MYMSMQAQIKYLQLIFFFSISIFGLYPFLLLFVNHMQTSRRWFLIIPFCYLQRERNLPCSGQTGLYQDKRCIKLQQDRANRVRKDDVKDGLCTCLWKKKKKGINHPVPSFHHNMLLHFEPRLSEHLCSERCFILQRPTQDLVPLMEWTWTSSLLTMCSLKPETSLLQLFGTWFLLWKSSPGFSSSVRCL